MAKYLIFIPSKEMLGRAPLEFVEKFKSGVEAAMERGAIEGAYAKVGGGLVFIVNSPGNEQLAVELRKNQITNAEVIPLVPLLELLVAHIDWRNTGEIKV